MIQSSLQRTWHDKYHINKYTLTTFMSMFKHNKVPHWFPCDKHLPLHLLKVRVGSLECCVTSLSFLRWKHWPRFDHLIYFHRPRRLRRTSHRMLPGMGSLGGWTARQYCSSNLLQVQHNSVTAVYIRRDYSLLIHVGLLVQHKFRIFNINSAVLSQGMW